MLRLLLLAGGAGISIAHFREFIKVVHDSDPDSLIAAYARIRRDMRHVLESDLDSQFDLPFERKSSLQIVKKDIYGLLKRANFRTEEAVRQISEYLVKTNVTSGEIPPYNPREGFGRWLEKVTRAVGPSALLNAAISTLSPEPEDTQKWRLSQR